ncbi:MAG: hypothetical protein HY675_00455 [Chloroflexi bacterium]|nr:hypothetical protein [Chloroflexota bacterium]
MTRYPCRYLTGEVELTEERERHIAERHPDLLPEHRHRIAETLADPDQVRRSARFGSARSFSRWYTDLRRGKHVVVVVVSELDPTMRHWIITAYVARRLAEGEIEWKRS